MLRLRVARFSRLTTADCRISGNVVAVVVTRLAKAAMVGGGGGGGGRIFMIVGSSALADDSRPGQEVVFLIFLLLFLLLITPANNDRTIFSKAIGPDPEFTTFSKKFRGCFDNFELKRSALPMCNSEKTVFRNLNDTSY
jgi:hypothetical protein